MFFTLFALTMWEEARKFPVVFIWVVLVSPGVNITAVLLGSVIHQNLGLPKKAR